jgi:hypothetical protein
MAYSFARISAALRVKVEDAYSERRGRWLRLREKGGKRHEMPCHHNLEAYLTAISSAPVLPLIPKARCSAPSAAKPNCSPAPPWSTTAAPMKSPSMRSNAWRFELGNTGKRVFPLHAARDLASPAAQGRTQRNFPKVAGYRAPPKLAAALRAHDAAMIRERGVDNGKAA